METVEPKKSLCRKIESALSDTGIVYWLNVGYGADLELRTVTYVFENGKERTRKISRLKLRDEIQLICSIQKKYPKIAGFYESMQSSWNTGNIPMTLAEIYELAGVV